MSTDPSCNRGNPTVTHPSIFISTWHPWFFSLLFPCLTFFLFPQYVSSISASFPLSPCHTHWCFICFLLQIKGSLFSAWSSSSICWSFFIETSLPTDRLILWRSKNPFFLSCFGCCPNSDISVSTSKMFHINISPTVIAHTEWTISPWQQSTTCCTDKWADIFPSYTSRVARGNCYCGPGINDVIKSGHK